MWKGLFVRLLDPVRHRRVLDVGTGTGFLALLLAECGHQVTAIDFSESMLAIAERKAGEAGLPITFRLGDAYQPPLRGQVFDAVVCRHLLWTLVEPERAVRAWTDSLHRAGRSSASNVFARAGLRHVRTELLESVDRVERSAMTLAERLEIRGQRYLVEGTVGDAGGRSLFSLTP